MVLYRFTNFFKYSVSVVSFAYKAITNVTRIGLTWRADNQQTSVFSRFKRYARSKYHNWYYRTFKRYHINDPRNSVMSLNNSSSNSTNNVRDNDIEKGLEHNAFCDHIDNLEQETYFQAQSSMPYAQPGHNIGLYGAQSGVYGTQSSIGLYGAQSGVYETQSSVGLHGAQSGTYRPPSSSGDKSNLMFESHFINQHINSET